MWIGTMFNAESLKSVIAEEAKSAGVWDWRQELAGMVTVRGGVNEMGEEVIYLLNYSSSSVSVNLPFETTRLLDDTAVAANESIAINPWDVFIGVKR